MGAFTDAGAGMDDAVAVQLDGQARPAPAVVAAAGAAAPAAKPAGPGFWASLGSGLASAANATGAAAADLAGRITYIAPVSAARGNAVAALQLPPPTPWGLIVAAAAALLGLALLLRR